MDERSASSRPSLRKHAKLQLSAVQYSMPRCFDPDTDQDPQIRGWEVPYGCGLHPKNPDDCTRQDRKDHREICLAKRAALANKKEKERKKLDYLDVADRTGRRRNKSRSLDKPAKKVRFALDSDTPTEISSTGPSTLNADLFFERPLQAHQEHSSRPQFLWREATDIRYICPPGGSCLCRPCDLFKSEKEHDDFVRRNRYMCGDWTCSCATFRVVRDPEDHDFPALWTCPIRTKDSARNRKAPFPLCPCWRVNPFCTFYNRDDHNMKVLQLLQSKFNLVGSNGLATNPDHRLHFLAFLEPEEATRERRLARLKRRLQLDMEETRRKELRHTWTPQTVFQMMCMNPRCYCKLKMPGLVFASESEHALILKTIPYYCTAQACPCTQKLFKAKEKHEEHIKDYRVLQFLYGKLGCYGYLPEPPYLAAFQDRLIN
jgi:hypothetical protein